MKFCGVPLQVFKIGVATKFPATTAVLELIAEKALIFPAPLAPIPIVEFEFVQLIEAPAGVELNVIAAVFSLGQTVWLVTAVIVGSGFTVIEKLCVAPVQLLAIGVATKFPVTLAVPAFTPANAAIFPVPLAPIPIVVFEFVQLIVVVGAAGVGLKLIAVVLALAQTV